MPSLFMLLSEKSSSNVLQKIGRVGRILPTSQVVIYIHVCIVSYNMCNEDSEEFWKNGSCHYIDICDSCE